ncbi:MAG: hypothetical protein MI892_01950 [Desulfobacterales bacterium]|nr:hypothetical protein [Desulfobacterales bacterium]
MNFTKNNILVSIILICLGITIAMGCGKKGPPLPPLKDGNVLAQPINLSYTVEDKQVTLTWNHKTDPENAKLEPEGFEVFLATKSLDGCEGCPFIFKSIGIVSMPETEYNYTMDEDLHYYFRVQALGADGMKSTQSDTLYIERQ